MKKHLIYGLVDPRDGQLRYIGRSSIGKYRPAVLHSARCGAWQKSLLSKGLKWEVVTIQDFDPDEDIHQVLNQAEIFWISYFRSMGANLTNLTDGGDGIPCNPDPEIRRKMSEAHRGSKNHFFGKTHDENALLKMRSRVVCLDDGRVFPGLNIAASHYGIAASSLSLVCSGKRNKVGGRRFAFVDG